MTPPKILLVEDNFVTADEIADRLKQLGFPDIATAYSGAEAVVLADDVQPNLILMDIHLGAGIDGIEAAAQIQTRRNVPVIYLTAYDTDATLARAKITDPSAYLVKPVRERELHIAIDIALYKQQTEAALEQSEERFRAVFEQAAAGMVIVLPDERLIEVNQKLCDMLGYTRDELLQLTVQDISFPDDRDRELEQVQEVLAGQQDFFNLEKRYRHKDGHPVWVNLSSNVVRDEQGAIDYALGVMVDISEQKQVEQALRDSEAQYRTLVETVPYGIAAIDRNGVFVFVNKANCRILGYEEDELIGKTIYDVIAEEEREEFKQFFEYVVQEQPPPDTHENRNVTKSGEVIDVQVDWDYTFDMSGAVNGFITIITDITERKRAETALRESQRKLDRIFNSVNDAIWFATPEGKLVEVNAAAGRMLGYTRDEMLGKHVGDFVAPDQKPLVPDRLARMKQAGQAHFETIHVAQDGSRIDVDINTRLDEFDGRPYIFSVIRDITERKRTEAALRQREHDLREANATKDRFFSIIAHDLKNPLHAVLSGARMLKERLQGSEDELIQTLSRELHEAAERVFKLLENLLTWARMQQDALPYTPGAIDLAARVQFCIGLVQPSANLKQITIRNLVPEDLLVLADNNMLAAILRNLLSNAVKFTQSGGKVTIKAALKDAMVEIMVTDTGVGISEEKCQRLFRVGEKGISSQGTDGERGTGLGLLLCQEFVAKHGGRIWVESEPGQGSTFRFTLPQAAPTI